MSRALSAFASLFVPRTFGGRVSTHSEFLHSQGQDRLLLRHVTDSLYWRLLLNVRGAGDFHSLVWERKSNSTWKPVARATHRTVRRVAAAWVADIHSLDPSQGTAIIQIARDLPISAADLPPGVRTASYAQYAWVVWDMRGHQLLSVLRECKGPWEAYDA